MLEIKTFTFLILSVTSPGLLVFMHNYVYMEHRTPPPLQESLKICSILGNLFWVIIKFRNCFGVDRGVRDDKIYINTHNSEGVT